MANVGDSRLYRIERSGIHQITRDHSYVEAMVSLGQMSRGSREYETKKNIITRAVGIGGHVEPDFFEVSLNPGDYILLCSDGLTNMVDNSAIYRPSLRCSQVGVFWDFGAKKEPRTRLGSWSAG